MRIALLASMFVFGIAAPFVSTASAQNSSLEITFEGAKATRVPDAQARLPKNAVPGVQFVTSDQMRQTKGPEKPGVFIVDSDGIPKNLAAQLKESGYQLSPNGMATGADGKPVAVFVHSLKFQVEAGKKSGGILENLKQFAGSIADVIIPAAKAASPHPFRCFEDDLFVVYDLGGFCRWQRVHTTVEAQGALADGTCGVASPPTRISLVSIQAGFLPRNIARRSCPSCSRASVSREVHYGCFWPAIGGTPTMRHKVNLFDSAPDSRPPVNYVVDWHL